MKFFRILIIIYTISFMGILFSYWDQIGSNSQVTPPTPTSKIALENLETKSSEVSDYTIQKSLLLSLRTQLEQGLEPAAAAEAMNTALERISKLNRPITEGYLQKAVDEPNNAILYIDEALDLLEQGWYGNLPASE